MSIRRILRKRKLNFWQIRLTRPEENKDIPEKFNVTIINKISLNMYVDYTNVWSKRMKTGFTSRLSYIEKMLDNLGTCLLYTSRCV